MKDSTFRRKYQKASIPWLLGKATEAFNAWIRDRDKDTPCISCGKWKTLEAGHYYPATLASLRYNKYNVNGQCVRCNQHLHANQINYRKGLIAKYGIERVEWLELQADYAKRGNFKWDRFELIEIILKYRNLAENFIN